jgi:hypothetical protein
MSLRVIFVLLPSVFWCVALEATAAQHDDDACRIAIPTALRLTLTSKYAGHRLPLSTDNLQRDREYQLEHGGNGCLRVTTGRFVDGVGEDIAILMTPARETGETLLVVAWQGRTRSWNTQEIWRWSVPTFRVYVEAAKPGRYKRSTAVEDPVAKDELTSIDSERNGILSGETGSFEYAFFWWKRRWVHVRVAE